MLGFLFVQFVPRVVPEKLYLHDIGRSFTESFSEFEQPNLWMKEIYSPKYK